jgi:hypothetical protein
MSVLDFAKYLRASKRPGAAGADARSKRRPKWPAPGSEDTELGVLMELEVGHGETKFTREFKLEAVRLIQERGVSYVQASQDLGVHVSQLRDWVKKFMSASVFHPSSGRPDCVAGVRGFELENVVLKNVV